VLLVVGKKEMRLGVITTQQQSFNRERVLVFAQVGFTRKAAAVDSSILHFLPLGM
jgi:hypothetical protein